MSAEPVKAPAAPVIAGGLGTGEYVAAGLHVGVAGFHLLSRIRAHRSG